MLDLVRRYSRALVANSDLNPVLAQTGGNIRPASVLYRIVNQISYGASNFAGPTRADYCFGDLSFDREPGFACVITDAGYKRRKVDLS